MTIGDGRPRSQPLGVEQAQGRIALDCHRGGRLVRCVTLWMNDLQAEDVLERVEVTIAVSSECWWTRQNVAMKQSMVFRPVRPRA
jgi:hypothetical protein